MISSLKLPLILSLLLSQALYAYSRLCSQLVYKAYKVLYFSSTNTVLAPTVLHAVRATSQVLEVLILAFGCLCLGLFIARLLSMHWQENSFSLLSVPYASNERCRNNSSLALSDYVRQWRAYRASSQKDLCRCCSRTWSSFVLSSNPPEPTLPWLISKTQKCLTVLERP